MSLWCSDQRQLFTWCGLNFNTPLALLTCSMSTLSAWSSVVRLWRSFIASLSSASLRSSIRRSAASSRLQIEEWTGVRKGQRTLRKRLENSNQRTLWQAWMICAVVPFCRDLRAESSTPLWLDRKMRDGKRWGFPAHVWYTCMQIAVCEIVGVFHLWHLQSESHRVLSLGVCQAAVTVAPSVCCCAALDASAPPPAGYTAAADECTGRRERMTEEGA